MTIKLVTLRTTQTLLCEIDCVDEKNIKLKRPVQVIVQPSKDGPMMGFSPFLDFANEFNTGIEISMENILCITTPSVEIENQYSKLFGSGITIASSIPKI